MPAAAVRPFAALALLAPLVGATAPKGLVPLLLVATLWQAFELGRARLWAPLPHAALIWPAALVVWAAASGLWAPGPAEPLRTVAGLAVAVLAARTFLVAARTLDAAGRRAVRLALLAGVLGGLAFLAVEVATDGALFKGYYRSIGRIEDYDDAVLNRRIAALLLFGWIAAGALAALRRGWLALALLAVLGVVVFGGSMHSAKLALLLSLLVAGLAFALGRPVHRAFAALLVAGIAVAPLLPFGPLAPVRWEGRILDDYYSAEHRLHIWRFAAERIADRPVTGWGLDASPHLPGGTEKLPKRGTRMSVHTHNGALQVWLELGAIGALLLAGLAWVAAAASGRPATPTARAAALGTLAAASGIFCLSFGVWQTAWLANLAVLPGLLAATLPDD